MSPKLKKTLLLLLAAVLLAGSSNVQRSLNRDREKLDLTRVTPLKNAPPVLAFTTVALGGFRGLISNMLWMRATDLQDDDKFFEMAQLADWITKLEPNFVQVWVVQAWNMAYNISVKFKDFGDRWRWVERGIELLRDEGIPLNPNETLLYRELAWFFQHKMGANLDDANMYYKREWKDEMSRVFGDTNAPNFDALIHPQTPDEIARANLLTNKYKMDPEFVKEVQQKYGPLEWRLPEAHAIYWACEGLKAAERNPTKIKKDDLITLRRVIYQSMQLSFQRGRLISTPLIPFDFGPNLDIIPKVSAAYEQAAEEDANNHDHILRAHRNFLRDAVYFLYAHHRLSEAAYWFKYIGSHYPDKTLLDGQTNSFPRNLTLDEYAVARVQEDVGETDQVRIKGRMEDLIAEGYRSLLEGDNDRAAGYELLAEKVRETYESKTAKGGGTERIPLPTIDTVKHEVLNELLNTDPEKAVLEYPARAALRSQLGMEPEPASAPSTNAPPVSQIK